MWHRMRRLRPAGMAALQLVLVVLAVYAMRCTTDQLFDARQRQRLPQGWSLVRPPVDVAAVGVRGDEVWTGGRDGLVLVDRRSLVICSQPPDGPSFGHVYAILAIDGTVWIGHNDGLTTYDARGWQGVQGERCRSLFRDASGRLWAGFDRAVGRLDGRVWTWLPPPPSEADVLFVDRDGSVWVGCASPDPSRGGLFHLEGERWTPIEGLPHPSVNAILRDRKGVLWVGTGFARDGGLARLSDGRWTTTRKDGGLAGEKVRCLYEDADGRMWVGSEYDGVAILGGPRRIVVNEAEGLAGRELKAVVREADGTWWLGTDGGMNRIRDAAIPR